MEIHCNLIGTTGLHNYVSVYTVLVLASSRLTDGFIYFFIFIFKSQIEHGYITLLRIERYRILWAIMTKQPSFFVRSVKASRYLLFLLYTNPNIANAVSVKTYVLGRGYGYSTYLNKLSLLSSYNICSYYIQVMIIIDSEITKCVLLVFSVACFESFQMHVLPV